MIEGHSKETATRAFLPAGYAVENKVIEGHQDTPVAYLWQGYAVENKVIEGHFGIIYALDCLIWAMPLKTK